MKFRISQKQILVILLVILILVQVYNRFSLRAKVTEAPDLDLEKQVTVANQVRIQAKPSTYAPGKSMTFLVSLESTQNREVLDIDLTEIALLEDQDGNPYHPTSWKVDVSTEYSRTGHLVFEGPAKGTKSIKLTIFEMEEHPFSWDLK